MNRIFKVALIVVATGVVIAGGIALYLFNMPHRDVQSAAVDYERSATDLVEEYLEDAEKANAKYLQEEGDSTIFAVSGKISSIRKNLQGNTVVLLKDESGKAGVSCTFTKETNASAAGVQIGQSVTVKGVIRSGAGFDEDLELYENVILEKCDLLLESVK